MTLMPCFYCGDPVDHDAVGTWEKGEGWRPKRGQGGANQIAFFEPHGLYAHNTCLESAKFQARHHIHKDQGSFF